MLQACYNWQISILSILNLTVGVIFLDIVGVCGRDCEYAFVTFVFAEYQFFSEACLQSYLFIYLKMKV